MLTWKIENGKALECNGSYPPESEVKVVSDGLHVLSYTWPDTHGDTTVPFDILVTLFDQAGWTLVKKEVM